MEHTIAKKKLYKGQSPTFLNINLFRPVGGLNPCPSTNPSDGEGLALLDISVSVATSESELFAELIPSFRNLISLNHFFSHFIKYSSMQRSILPDFPSMLEGFRSAPISVGEVCVYPLKAAVFCSPTTEARLRVEEFEDSVLPM